MKNIFTTVALILCTSYLSKAQDQVYLELPQGWSMFGYVSTEDTDVIEAFSEISNDIEIVKDGWGMAYIPDWGFNGLGNLEYARGYQIKMINQVDDFQFESVIASSMDNNEALIALEELLFNLQENMMALQDEVMYNHMNQEDLITSLQIDLQASQNIEWENHLQQDDQIFQLQEEMNYNNAMQDEQTEMLGADMMSMIDYQSNQIMMLEHEVDSLQTQLASVLSLCENLQSQINNLPTSFSLGDYHEGGGVVFFVDSTGEHGLVADMSHTLEELTSIEVFYSFCHESSDGNSILLYDMVLNEEDLDQFCDGWFVPNSWTLSDIYHAIGPSGISYPSLNNLDFIWSSTWDHDYQNFIGINFNEEDEEFIGVPSSLTAGVVLVRSF